MNEGRVVAVNEEALKAAARVAAVAEGRREKDMVSIVLRNRIWGYPGILYSTRELMGGAGDAKREPRV